MIWLLTVLISCLTASAQICNVTLQVGKVIQPKPSVLNGATFLSHLHTDTKELCQKECCNDERCDTVLYTDSKVGPKGNNCFYFDCLDHCVFRDSTPEESNFSVAIISRSTAPQELPDFSNIFVSSGPDVVNHADNATESHQADSPVEPQKSSTPASDVKADEEKVQPDTSAPLEQQQPESQSAEPVAEPVAKIPDSPSEIPESQVKTPDATVKPEVSATSKVETAKNNTVDAKEVQKEAEQTEPTQSSSPDTNAVTVKNNDEKPDIPDTIQKAVPKPATAKPDDVVTEKEEVTPTEKAKLPNEVPVVEGKVEVNTDVKVNGTVSKASTSEEDQSKTVIGQEKQPAVVVVDKPEETKKKSDESMPAANVSVEVDIHTIQTKQPDTYTKKDVMFWVSVVGGSTLIVLGLGLVVRYYGNKRRRLYSSLTDDYLINGMYSI
ncbi:muscle M-line assembly protein unc-89-like isoform X2 [Bolinopsis microptera]|uniref:muscle M-line assembly protein unc-89-like isoform X2 n=1 Tax=Bolinopsis microptera TaxID=2820187 RepID=UPI003078FE0B